MSEPPLAPHNGVYDSATLACAAKPPLDGQSEEDEKEQGASAFHFMYVCRKSP